MIIVKHAIISGKVLSDTVDIGTALTTSAGGNPQADVRPVASTLQGRLFQLIALALIPIACACGSFIYLDFEAGRTRASDEVLVAARGMALAVDRELSIMSASLETLAFSLALRSGDMAEFRREAEALAARQGSGANVILLDASGQQMLNTARSDATSLPRRERLDNLQYVLKSGAPRVSDLYTGAVLGRPVIGVDVPVKDPAGAVTRILSLNPPLSFFSDVLAAQRPKQKWVVSIFDRDGVIVARTPNPDRFVGAAASPTLKPLLTARNEDVAATVSLEGVPLLTAWSRSSSLGWPVAIGVPMEAVYAPLWRNVALTTLALAAGLGAALLLAKIAAARINGPIRALVGVATADRRDQSSSQVSLGLREVDEVAAALRKARLDVERRARELEASQTQLNEAQRLGRLGSWNWNTQSGVTTGSDELYHIFGLDPATPFPVFEDQRGVLFPAEDWERLDASIKDTLQTGNGYDLQLRAYRNGQPISVICKSEVVRNAVGNIVGLRGTVQDVSDQADRDADIARAHRIAGLGSLWVDLRNGFQNHRSTEYLRIHGLPPTAVNETHEDWVARLHPDDRVRVAQSFLDAINGSAGEYNVEYRIIRPSDGKVRAISVFTEIERDAAGKAVRLFGVHRDVTDRRAAEQAVIDGEKRLQLALDTGGGAAWDLDLETGHMIWSEGQFAMFGLEPSARREATEAMWKETIAEEDRRAVSLAWDDAIATRTRFESTHRISVRGTIRWIKVAGRFDYAASGKPSRFAGVAFDVTDLQQQKEILAAAVASAVAEREAALRQLHEAQKIETIGHLTGGVAHDFNNLLAAVLSNLNLAKKRVADAKAAELIDGAIKGAERGAALTKRLLAFARRQDLKAESVDLASLVADMHELLARSLGPSIRILTSFPPDLPPVFIDANQLELAILNLAVNARDAMPTGGTLRIEATARDARPADLPEGEYVQLCISDTGLGMDNETLKRAAEPFFTTKGVGKGTGLGLSMVQGLALQSGGVLRIASEQERGTSIAIWLPQAKTAPAPAEQPFNHHSETSCTRLTILVVDDDALVAIGTIAMLEDLGHTVFDANSGRKALEAIAEHPEIELVITDHAMPGMTGTELARKLRIAAPRLPIVLATGYAELPNGEDPGLPRLGKPFSQRELQEMIARIMPAMVAR